MARLMNTPKTLRIDTIAHYRAMLDALPQAVCIIDSELCLRDRNETFVRMFGNLQSPCYRLLYNRDEPCPCCLFCRVQQTGEAAVREVRTEIQGNPRYFRISATPLGDSQPGSGFRILYSIEDITSRAVAEKTIGDYNTMLETTARETILRLRSTERKFAI